MITTENIMRGQLGEKIRKVRELKGYTQEYMASQLDISQRACSKLEREETKLDWSRITNIADILELEPKDLIAFDDTLIFNQSPQSGKNNHNVYHDNFPQELKLQYESRIAQLESEVAFLRLQLDKR